MPTAIGTPLPGTVSRSTVRNLRRLRLDEPASSPEPARGRSTAGEDEALLRALEARFGSLGRCFAPPRRRRRRGLRGWLRRLWRGEVRSRARFELARELSCLHAGSRWTRGEVFSGTTSAFSVPELFGMMRAGNKSGVLGLALGPESVSFHVDGGRLVAGRSDNAPPEERLGAILVRRGALSRKALRSVLGRRASDGRPLGDTLLRHELVTPDELRSAVREQVNRLVRRSQDVLDAPFLFQECGVEEAPDGLRIDLDELLLEAARAQDEERCEGQLHSRLRSYRPVALGAKGRLLQ